MQPPSVTPSRGHSSWQGTLLTVSLLLPWSLPTLARLSIESVPRAAAEGQDVLLRNPSRAEALLYSWYKGDSIETKDRIGTYAVIARNIFKGPAHTRRETIYHNGSLMLQNANLGDTGTYLLRIEKTDKSSETLTGQIHVFRKLPKTSIKSSSSYPVEDQGSVTLLCEPETQNTTTQWVIHNQSLPDNSRLELTMDNRTLTVHTVTRNESGFYECRTRNPMAQRPPTISPSAEHYSPGDSTNLTCQAGSNSSVQFSWFINEAYRQSTQQQVVPHITVGDSGHYICHVAAISRTTLKTLSVSESLTKPSIQASNTAVTETTGPVVFTCLTNHNGISISWFHEGERLWLTERMKLSQEKSSLTINPVRMEDAGKYQCEVSNPGSAIRSGSLILTVEGVGSEGGRVLSAGTITGIVIGGLVGVLLVAALGYFLFHTRTRGRRSEPGHQQPPAPTSGRGKSDNSASMHPLYANQAAVPIYEDLLKPDTNIYTEIPSQGKMSPRPTCSIGAEKT